MVTPFVKNVACLAFTVMKMQRPSPHLAFMHCNIVVKRPLASLVLKKVAFMLSAATAPAFSETLFKIVTVKDEIVVGLNDAELGQLGNDAGAFNDQWGNPLRFSFEGPKPADSKVLIVTSDGPDGQAGTPDDITERHPLQF